MMAIEQKSWTRVMSTQKSRRK